MSYIGLNLTWFYVQDSGFGFQRDGSFNAEIISASLARGVPLLHSLCLGLVSYLLDHSQISVMMSRSVLCSRAIGCSSIQCEHSWSEWVDEKTRETYGDQAAILFWRRSSGRRSRISCASNIGFLGTGTRGGVILSPWDLIFQSKTSPQLMDKSWASGRNPSAFWWYLSPRHCFVRHKIDSCNASWFVRRNFT